MWYYTGMSLYDYEVFNTVVEQGSFNKASRILHVTPSAVSHIIAKLEEDFGFPLLYRNRTGIALTPDGEKMLPSIKEILQCNEQLNQEISDLNGVSNGIVRIATISSVAKSWLPSIVKGFKEEHPNVTVRISQGSYNEVADWINSGSADLAFVTGSYKGTEETELIPLAEEQLLCAMPRDKKTKKKKCITLDELKDEILIHPLGIDDEVQEYIDKNGLVSGYEYVFDDDSAKLAMVEQGLGICILPELSFSADRYDVKVLPLDPPGSRKIFLAVAHAKFTAPATEEMREHITEYVENI